MTTYLQSGNTFRVASDEAIQSFNKLPVGNYVAKYNSQTGEYYLEMADKFEPIKKYYGKTCTNADRVISTFIDRPSSTGCMMVGEKGSGKSLLSKLISIKGYEKEFPTIIVNQQFYDDNFKTFIQQIDSEAIVLFDEFEKVYNDKEAQNHILTLFDGVFETKKLFLITMNDKYGANYFLRNRPGRIYYAYNFVGIEEAFIIEYCEENLLNQDHTNEIVKISKMMANMNFDMLKAIVEELNRYGETVNEVLDVLNIDISDDKGDTKYIAIVYKGKTQVHEVVLNNNPLASTNYFGFNVTTLNGNVVENKLKDEDSISLDSSEDDYDSNYVNFNLDRNDLVSFDTNTGIYKAHKNGYDIFISKKEEKFDFRAL